MAIVIFLNIILVALVLTVILTLLGGAIASGRRASPAAVAESRLRRRRGEPGSRLHRARPMRPRPAS